MSMLPADAHRRLDGATAQLLASTPAATWRASGEPDPHGNRYDCERATLCMGDMTDDELANGVYLHGDGTHGRPSPQDIIAGKAHSPIAWLTAAKDRIRWLSRRLVDATAQQTAADHVPAGPEYEAAVDAKLGLVKLPPIRISAQAHTLLQRIADARGLVLQAVVREALEPGEVLGAQVAAGRGPVTIADVLDALNLFNRPKPSEDDGPWEGGHFIRVDHLPAFINVIAAAWFAPQPAPAPAALLVRDIANDLGVAALDACDALRKLGHGPHSVNMAVTPAAAADLTRHFAKGAA